MRSSIQLIQQPEQRSALRRVVRFTVLVSASLFVGFAIGATAQTIDGRQWQGVTAVTRQPEQVVASTLAEWRSLWSRVGAPAPDLFEPGRMSAVGIFLGTRTGSGYSVNVLSTSRRRDRIIVVFEERAPADAVIAQRAPHPPPTTRNVSGMPTLGSSFAAPGTTANAVPPGPARPAGPLTSPWAIVLINRADLPVSVEQRLFR